MIERAISLVPWQLRSVIKHIPVAAQLQRLLVRNTLEGKSFVHQVDAGPAKGMRFLICLPEDKGIWTGTYELAFAKRLAAAVVPGAVAYDIGGWHGFFAAVLSAQGAREVHVFEPLPPNVAAIRTMIDLNRDHEIVLHDCALGECDGEMDLVVMAETSMAKLAASTFQANAKAQTRISVQVHAIDALIARQEMPPPSVMKIDVEGAEVLVLRGALETLRRARPRLFIEVHSTTLLRQCTTLLQGEGYQLNGADPDPQAAAARDVYQIEAQPL